VTIITEQKRTNIVLFPKTEHFYEEQLTQLLKVEQYEKAIELLSFLLQLPGVSTDKLAQWQAILVWLQTMFPEYLFEPSSLSSFEQDEEEELEEEDELRRQRAIEKANADSGYLDKIIEKLEDSEQTFDQQLLALEQIQYAELTDHMSRLCTWLEEHERHPLLQFKCLQSLKRNGMQGELMIQRNGLQVTVEVQDTPLHEEEYPHRIKDVMLRLQVVSEVDHPDFYSFASGFWHDFIAMAFAMPIYNKMLQLDESEVDLWAAALHAALQELVFGSVDGSRIREQYAITDKQIPGWESAYFQLKDSMQTMFQGLS
jgi:hypothetical protein